MAGKAGMSSVQRSMGRALKSRIGKLGQSSALLGSQRIGLAWGLIHPFPEVCVTQGLMQSSALQKVVTGLEV